MTALLSLLGFVAAGIIIVIGILAFNMGTMMDKFAKFFKVASEGKGSVAGLAADIMALGMAMTMMGNPLALAGTFASIQFMKQQIKAAEASARIAEAEASKAEAMERMFSTAGGIDLSGFSVAFTEIARLSLN